MFFNSFSKTAYSFDFVNQSPTVVTNIFNRIRMRTEVLQNALSYYKYIVKPGDTPEIVAHKEYGDPRLHWIICLVNNLTDPHFDFPLDDASLDKMIAAKYNASIESVQTQILHYDYETVTTVAEVGGPTTVTTKSFPVTIQQYNFVSDTLQNQAIYSPSSTTVVFRQDNTNPSSDIKSTVTVQSQYKPVYVYDYEVSNNESKRTIKILKQRYIQSVIAELGSIVNG